MGKTRLPNDGPQPVPQADPDELNQRQRRILKEVCDAFISTGEPVGSRTISRFSDLACSPATIRNEMQDLELMGYLASPHTSAGRIPTEKGYRFYVSFLASFDRISRLEERLIEQLTRRVEEARDQRDDVVRYALRLATEETRLAGIALAPQALHARLRSVRLFRVLEDKAMLVTVDDCGQINDQLVSIPPETSDAVLENLAGFLNTELCHHQVMADEAVLLRKSHELVARHSRLVSALVQRIRLAMENPAADTLFLEGFMHFFDQPEFRDPAKMRAMVSLLDRKEQLLTVLARNLDQDDKIRVDIGSDSGLAAPDLSVVTARYLGPHRSIGRIGVIGPLRMDYGRVVAILAEISSALTRLFTGSSATPGPGQPGVRRPGTPSSEDPRHD